VSSGVATLERRAGQRFTNAGTPLGPEFAVSSYMYDSMSSPP